MVTTALMNAGDGFAAADGGGVHTVVQYDFGALRNEVQGKVASDSAELISIWHGKFALH